MAINRRIVAHGDNYDNQWLKVDHNSRYIENDSEDWQFIFGPNSALSNADQVVKLAAKFNENTFNNIQIAAYLYDSKNNAISSIASCQFDVFKVSPPDWTENYIISLNGFMLPNGYFYVNQNISSFGPIDFFGGDTLMIQATIVRLGITYRERIYVNHLGMFDNVTRLRSDVEFLEVTKKDE